MRAKEQIEAILSQYKGAILSYSWNNHYRDNKPLEQGFNRQLMADTRTSHLYDLLTALFLELRLPQAHRYIAAWESTYIIDGEVCDPDRARYESLKKIGRAFIDEAYRIAAKVCEPEGGDVTPRGRGYLPPDKGTVEKGTDRNLETPTRGKGRPKETLQDRVIGGDTGFIKKLHTLIDGKKGKDFCLYIVASIKLGKLTRPTYTQVKNEFGDIGNKAGYNRYLDEQKFTKVEIEGAMSQINKL